MNATVHFTPSPIVFSRAVKPAWAIGADRVTDLSDVWVEECDPQNKIGALVTGLYTARTVDAWNERHECIDATLFDLDGIAVETSDGTHYVAREALVRMWGMDTIWRVERVEMECGG